MRSPLRRRPPGRLRLIASRLCIALAAACLVVTVAIAALSPPGLRLASALLQLDPGSVPALQHLVVDHLPATVWTGFVLPFLRRPAWMPTMMATILAGGLAMSIRPRP